MLGIPLGTTQFTFPRFLAAAAKFTYRYNLTGFIRPGMQLIRARKVTDSAANSAMRMQAYEDIEKAVCVGTSMLIAATAFRATPRHPLLNTKKKTGKTGDLLSLFPLAPYLLLETCL